MQLYISVSIVLVVVLLFYQLIFYDFHFCFQAFCSQLKQSVDDRNLILALAKSLNVYFNHTGNTKCFDIGNDVAGGLDSLGWDYQVSLNLIT